MKEISEHDLTGYLLGALEPAEELAVKTALDESPELRARVAVLEEKLAQMPDRFVEIDPPADLAEKTMNTLSIVESSLRSEGVSDQQAIRTSNAGKRERRYKSASYAGREFAGSGSSWSVMDLIVGAVVCFVVAAVLLPSISNSRFQANLLKCE
ncbi:MAG: hypothetical protein VX768_11245, partial [Planctomycetota bacterium]|nr:hypothetical protein [Planctomycetota bacterium]